MKTNHCNSISNKFNDIKLNFTIFINIEIFLFNNEMNILIYSYRII